MSQPLTATQRVQVDTQTTPQTPPTNCFSWLYELIASILSALCSCFSRTNQQSLRGRTWHELPPNFNFDQMKAATPALGQWFANDGVVNFDLAYVAPGAFMHFGTRYRLTEAECRGECERAFKAIKDGLQKPDYKYYLQFHISKHKPHHLGPDGHIENFVWQNRETPPAEQILPTINTGDNT